MTQTLTMPVECVGGELDGAVIEVPHTDPIAYIRTPKGWLKYLWMREDDGSWFLDYHGFLSFSAR